MDTKSTNDDQRTHQDSTTNSLGSQSANQITPSTQNMELLHHVPVHGPRDYHMRSTALPHDLKFVKTSELLPMAYDDFTKCLEEDFRRSPLADDDCVVPSVSPNLPRGRCSSSSSSSEDDDDESWEEYPSESQDFLEKREYEHCPSLNRCSPFGTLNWGLTPTIIYKTPDCQSTVDVVGGNDCMKCSITEGNVELITPPPLQHSKQRLARKRKLTCRQRRRKIHFGDEPVHEGVQEVPNDEQDSDKDVDSDSSLGDPMWFEEDYDWDTTDKDQNTRTSNDEVKEYLRKLQKLLPIIMKTIKRKSKRQILHMAVQHIQALRKRIEYLTTCVDNVKQVELCTADFSGTEDVFEVLPQFSWSDIDEPCYEIQAILNSLSPLGNLDTKPADSHTPTSTTTPTKVVVGKPKKKRKYTKRKKTSKQPGKSKAKMGKGNNEPASKCSSENSQGTFTPPFKYSPSPYQNQIYISPNRKTPTSTISLSPMPGSFPFKAIGSPLILPKPTTMSFPTSGFRRLSPAPLLLSPSVPLSSNFPCSPLVSRCVPMITTRMPGSPVFATTGILPLTNSATAQTTLTTSIVGQTRLACLQTVPGLVMSMWDSSDNEAGLKQGKGEKIQKKKALPNGYMLYCKDKRACLIGQNPNLSPGRITKLLSQNWNQSTEDEKRPYKEEAVTLRHDENEWIMERPF